MKTLKDVKVGETATVARLHGEGPVKRRIMDRPLVCRLCRQVHCRVWRSMFARSHLWVTRWS